MRILVLLAIASFALSACASTGHVPRPYPGAPIRPGTDAAPVPARAGEPSSPAAEAAVGVARTLVGAPYRSGGADPAGFDCSGFVQYVFLQAGLRLPRSVREQFDAGIEVDARAVRPGDLLFFATSGREVSHVGLALGEDTFVHAPSVRGVVRVERWSSPYWATRFVGARRIE